MGDNSFHTTVESLFKGMDSFITTKTVVGDAIHIGDTIIAGTSYGKVRAMINDRGEKVKKALPSTPVEVLGLNDVPAG